MQKLLMQRNSVIKYLLAAIILAIPLYPKFPFLRLPFTYVAVRLEDFLLLGSGFVFFVLAWPELKSILKNSVAKAICFYLVAGLLSLFAAVFLTKSVGLPTGILHLARRVEYFLPFFLGFIALKVHREDLEFYLRLSIIVVLITFIYGFGQKFFAWPVIITQNLEYSKGIALRWIPGSHINSTFAGHYDLATYLVLTLPFLITSFFVFRGWVARVILLAAIGGGYWLLANSISRISIVSFLGATSLALILVRKYKIVPFFLIGSLLIFGLSTDLRARYLRVFEVMLRNAQSVSRVVSKPASLVVYAADTVLPAGLEVPTPTPQPVFEDRSTSIRLNVEWPRALRALAKNPLLGTGYSSITLATDNDYLRLLGETGVIGFMAFGLVFLKIGKKLFQVIPLTKNFQGIDLVFICSFVGSLIGLGLNAFFIDIFEASKIAIPFWLWVGFLISRVENKLYE